MTEYMEYRERVVEVFGRTPTGQPIPRLHDDVDGENVGDFALANGKAMFWDCFALMPSPWKDFAVWRPVN